MMRLVFAIRARVRAIVRSRALDREMREEMAAHLEQATERFMRRGLSEADARHAARREFGNVAVLQDKARDARGARWIESCAGDVRFAMRHFSRTPLTTVTLVLVLALGIGVNSAIFSFVQTLAMRPPPAVAASDALVRVRGIAQGRVERRLRPRDFSVPELNAIAAHTETFTSVAGWSAAEMVLDAADGSDSRALRGQFVTSNYFSTLGVRPERGPGLPTVHTGDVPGTELVAVIAHWLWEALGADTTIIGRVVRVNSVPVRVVGVAPARFQGPISGPDDGASIWVPLESRPSLVSRTPRALVSRDSTLLQAVARLTANTTVERATTVVRVVAASWVPNEATARDAAGRAEETIYTSDVVPLRGDTAVGGGDALAFVLIGAAGLLILLIVCTNVSALLVGAAVARRREIGIRLSMGASRARVVRQLVTESSLIALAGGALGLLIYWSIIRGIAWVYIDPGIGPDLGTAAFTAFIALGTGMVFGLSPALHATRVDVASALKTGGGGATSRSRLQRAFIVAQICLTQPLLVGLAMIVGVMISEVHDGSVDNPLADRMTRVDFGTGGASSGSSNEKQVRVRETMDRVAQLPGVEAVVPEASGFDVADFRVRAADRGNGRRAEEAVRAHVEGAAPGYFALQNIPMLRGRELVAADTAAHEMAVVIDAALARDVWGDVDPIGKRLDVASKRLAANTTAVVVGVFDSARATTRGAGRVYTAQGGHWRKDVYLIRTRGAGTAIVPVVRRLARAAIPDVPLYRIVTIEQLARQERNDVMLLSATGSGGGLLALLLASIGIYGVVALSVRQRYREIGVRIALGARPRQVITMFFVSGLRLSVVGIVLGLPLSVIALHELSSSVGGELPVNMPVVGVAIAVIVVAVASLATWIPARRAARVDPLVAIRVE
jgi:putative ABC transport system permease protein